MSGHLTGFPREIRGFLTWPWSFGHLRWRNPSLPVTICHICAPAPTNRQLGHFLGVSSLPGSKPQPSCDQQLTNWPTRNLATYCEKVAKLYPCGSWLAGAVSSALRPAIG